ncbi:MAG: caspase family protein [Granulosicoccus sp.]
MSCLNKLGICLGLLLAASYTSAAQHALLIGVSNYSDPRVADLEGPVNDVNALQKVLIEHWQFDAANITTLINKQATESAITQALSALPSNPQAGDDIIIYFSGHGTSASDPDLGSRLNLPDGTGAIVSSDFDPDKLNRDSLIGPADDGLLVGRYELKPQLKKLDERFNVLIMFDACFAGNAARTLASPYTPKNKRQLNLLAHLGELFQQTPPLSQTNEPDDSFTYTNTVYFGAAAENQYAVDFSQAELDAGIVSSIDGLPHGGFTDALLRVLSAPHKQSNASSTASASKTGSTGSTGSTENTGNTRNTSSSSSSSSSSSKTANKTRATQLELSYARLFNRLVNQFNTHCVACGHTPISLPSTSNDQHALLSRPILRTRGSAPEPALLNDALIVAMEQTGTLSLDDLQLANSAVQSHSTLVSQGVYHSPDISFLDSTTGLQANASDGQLITRFPDNVDPQSVQRWLRAQQWLKQRRLNDLANEQGNLRVDFRHPMYGNTVSEGDYLHFTVLSEKEASLLAMTMNAQGQLSVLYPVSEQEAQSVLPANEPLRIPSINDLQLQVTPVLGTDIVLFYTLPPAHPLLADVLELAQRKQVSLKDARLEALERAFDNGSVNYSASSIRIISSEAP